MSPTFTSPSYLVAGLVAALTLIVLHLLTRRRQRATPFPTTRFVPDREAASVVRLHRLQDAGLLGLRLLAVTCIAAAAARPTWFDRSRDTARVVVATGRSTADVRTALDSARRLAMAGPTTVIVTDSVAHIADSRGAGPAPRHGTLSAALALAVREGLALKQRYRRVEVHVAGAVHEGDLDAATAGIRALWPDSLILHPLPDTPSPDSSWRPILDLSLGAEDPVGAAMRLGAPTGDARTATVRVRRGVLQPADSAWASASRRVLLLWPEPDVASSRDSLSALASIGGTSIGYFRPASSPPGRSIVWWADGTAAATEESAGVGCIRRIGFAPSPFGDAPIASALRRQVRRLLAPCGDAADATPLTAATRHMLEVPPVQAGKSVAAASGGSLGLTLILVAFAVAALAVEQRVRAGTLNGSRT